MTYQGPRKMHARYAGRCAECGATWAVGETMVYFPKVRVATCIRIPCINDAERKAMREDGGAA